MNHCLSPIGFNQEMHTATKRIKERCFTGDFPPRLYHYTSAETVPLIIQSRCIWGTCLADQSDRSELLYSIALLSQAVEELDNRLFSEFELDVLRRVSTFMEDRRKSFYIACFSGDAKSAHHRSNYGKCCLELLAPFQGSLSLRFPLSSADWWYQRVVYDQAAQRSAVGGLLKAIISAIRKNTQGESKTANGWIEQRCAAIAASYLLSICVGFKDPKYKRDQEWRLVCCPRMNPLSSAPSMDDEAFAANIRILPRRHVEFIVPRPQQFPAILMIPPVPFVALHCEKNDVSATASAQICKSLMLNKRPDLIPLSSK